MTIMISPESSLVPTSEAVSKEVKLTYKTKYTLLIMRTCCFTKLHEGVTKLHGGKELKPSCIFVTPSCPS
jgi:hypothetical protein